MAIRKNISKTKLIVCLFILFGSNVVVAQSDWVVHTSFKDVGMIRIINDTLFAAASGGLIAITDNNQSGVTYNNQDGLGTNNITDIIEDSNGQKWITGFGRLIRFNADNSKQYMFFDNDNNLFPLYRLVDGGDFLWVGTDRGLVLFSKYIDDGQIQESYQLFGSLNPAPAVYDILLEGDSIFIATSNGLAKADRTNPIQLKSPSNWTTYDLGSNPELESDMIKNIIELNSIFYVATDKEMFRFDDPVFTPIGFGDGVELHHMSLDNDTIFVYYEKWNVGSLAYINSDTIISLQLNGLTAPAYTGINYDGVRWLGSDGIYFETAGTFEEYIYTSLPGNDITDLMVNSDGEITANFRGIGAATLEDSLWVNHDFWIRSGVTKVISDSSGNPMIGTIGNGLWIVKDNQLINYDENNSTMRGNSDVPPFGLEFVYIPDLVTDGRYVYTVCYRAINNYPVAIGDLSNLDSPAGWDSIGVIHGLSDIFVISIDLKGEQLVVGSESDGIFLCDVGSNPFNTDITCRHYTRENSLLISNSTRVVRFAPDGSFWVGTNFGLSRYDEGIDRFRDVSLPDDISSDITALEFDGRGNLWIGTKDGLAYRDAVTGNIETYKSLNSDLPSDLINEITVDSITGNIYIMTNAGYVFVPSQTGRPVYDVNEVLAFPNPFIVSSDNEKLNFNFAQNGVVSIFNVAGEKINEMNVNLGWDGRNQKGEEVASGVYIFLVTDTEGQIGQGKFLLVRK